MDASLQVGPTLGVGFTRSGPEERSSSLLRLASAVCLPMWGLLIAISVVVSESSAHAQALIIDVTDGPTASNPPGDDGSPGEFYNGATGSAELSTTPVWWQTNAGTAGYNGSRERFSALNGGAGQTSVWTFTGLAPGTYSVHAFYFPAPNRTTAAPYEIFDGTAETGALVASPTVNQELAPDDLTVDDGQGEHTWESLSDGVAVTSGTLTVRLTSLDNPGNDNFVMADAIRVERAVRLGINRISYSSLSGKLTLSWDSRAGKQYDLLSSTDPEAETDPSTWSVVPDAENLAATPPENTLSVTRPADGARFYVVREENAPPPPPVFSDDFESVPDPDWTIGAYPGDTGNTIWERGAPVGDLGGGATGPGTGANGSANCFGTNLTAIYGSNTDIYLRSPAIDLTSFDGGDTATLTLQYYVDTDLAQTDPDVGTIRVLNANNLSEQLGADLTGVSGLGGIGVDWITFSELLPAEALGQTIVLEFQFTSNSDANNFGGWYLDDVEVTISSQ